MFKNDIEMQEFFDQHKGDFIVAGGEGHIGLWVNPNFSLEKVSHLLYHVSQDIMSMLEEVKKESEKN